MKTLKEFDYDLWAIEENGKKRYFARVKATGEETEIDIKVMRLLLSQEKQMRREYAKQQTNGTNLSLDAICDSGDMDEAAWMIDNSQSIEAEIMFSEATNDFCKRLTQAERLVYLECIVGGKTKSVYAAEHGVKKQTVQTLISRIKEKAKKFF